MLVTILIGIMVMSFTFFCNGMLLQEAIYEAKEANLTLHEEWERLVKEAQDTKFGATCMKMFYFIPTVAALIDRRMEINW